MKDSAPKKSSALSPRSGSAGAFPLDSLGTRLS